MGTYQRWGGALIKFILPEFRVKKVFRKKKIKIIFMAESLKGFGWNNVGPALQMVAQHYFKIGPMYRVMQVVAVQGIKRQDKHGQSPNSSSMLGQRRIRLTGIKPAMGCDAGPTLNRYWVRRTTLYLPGTSYRLVHWPISECHSTFSISRSEKDTQHNTAHGCWPAPAMVARWKE